MQWIRRRGSARHLNGELREAHEQSLLFCEAAGCVRVPAGQKCFDLRDERLHRVRRRRAGRPRSHRNE